MTVLLTRDPQQVLTQHKYDIMTKNDLLNIVDSIPGLEKLTILVDEKGLLNCKHAQVPVPYRPEVDGNLVHTGMAPSRISYVITSKKVLQEVDKLKVDYPEKKFLVVKMRFERQFIETEGLDIPEVRDPMTGELAEEDGRRRR